ncbi:hypothetical protein ACWEOZ_21420 [Actinoplanes sp. NPDC004185]
MSDDVRTAGSGGLVVAASSPGDEQALLHNDLIAVMTRDIPSVAPMLAATVRGLFEQGSAATTVEEAGRLLARATGEAFSAERAAVHLVGPDGRSATRPASGSPTTPEACRH